MKLPRMLAGLAGPSTPELQKTFLRDLKHAFRERVEQRAPPLSAGIDMHLQSVLAGPRVKTGNHHSTTKVKQLAPGVAAQELYIQGNLTSAALHDLIGRSQSKQDLTDIRTYALKAGNTQLNRPTDLSARYAAKLLHLGHFEEVARVIEQHTSQWIMIQSAHPLLLQYAAKSPEGIVRARKVFDNLVAHDAKNQTTALIRAMLRLSVRANSLPNVLHCLSLSTAAARGQETGLAQWLTYRGEYSLAFMLLKLPDSSRAKEGVVGLDLARRLMLTKDYSQATTVLDWIESRYILSLQGELKQLRAEMNVSSSTRAQTENNDHVWAGQVDRS